MNVRTFPIAVILCALVFWGCSDLSHPTQPLTSASSIQGARPHGETWRVPGDFPTIQDAIDADVVQDGDRILVGPGTFAGAVVTKGVHIKGKGKAVINTGPKFFERDGQTYTYGFLFPPDHSGDGASISHFRFDNVAFAIFNRGADDVTIEHNRIYNPIQGISHYASSGGIIRHNTITDLRTLNGGGIGIILLDRKATPEGVRDNLIAHNKISGTLHVWEKDGGGYDGSGIVLYADFRGTSPGAKAIAGNRVARNNVSLISDNPDVVGVNAFELTDTRDDPTLDPVIFDNVIVFNDFRGTASQIVLTPENLDEYNEISRNFGDNRGAGSRPPLPVDPGKN